VQRQECEMRRCAEYALYIHGYSSASCRVRARVTGRGSPAAGAVISISIGRGVHLHSAEPLGWLNAAGEEGEGDEECGDRATPDALSSSDAARLWSASLRDCLRGREG
jgi:hypothetical protein